MKDHGAQYKGFKELNIHFQELSKEEKKIYEDRAARVNDTNNQKI